MKHSCMQVRVSCWRLALMFIFAFSCVSAVSEKISLSFDQLYPETPLQKVLEECMRLQYEFDTRGYDEQMHEQEASLFIDVVVGRLFHMHSCIENLVKQKIFIHPEDRRYLLKIFDGLLFSYQKLLDAGLSAKGAHVVTLLTTIKQKLHHCNEAEPVRVPTINMPVAPICLAQKNAFILLSV